MARKRNQHGRIRVLSRKSGDVFGSRASSLSLPPLRFSNSASTFALVGASTQSKRRSTVIGVRAAIIRQQLRACHVDALAVC